MFEVPYVFTGPDICIKNKVGMPFKHSCGKKIIRYLV